MMVVTATKGSVSSLEDDESHYDMTIDIGDDADNDECAINDMGDASDSGNAAHPRGDRPVRLDLPRWRRTVQGHEAPTDLPATALPALLFFFFLLIMMRSS